MKGTSTALKAHMAGAYQTLCTCIRVELTDGTIIRFADHDDNIVISGYAGVHAPLNGTYLSAVGFFMSDVETTSMLNVDNVEIQGPQISPAIIETDLLVGRWDNAACRVFVVNWAQPSMGPHYEREGWLGEVTVQDGQFKAEIRGLAQAYTNTLVELTSPSCRYNLGDDRCQVSMTGAFAVTGTLTGASTDRLTLYDSSRAEAGPSAGVEITGVSNANPGVVTMADDSLNLVDGEVVTISGVLGPALVNAVTIAHNPSGATFQLSVDTSDTAAYPAYISGGTVARVGGASGFFDGGLLRFTSGANNGLSFEVKAYVPGQITLLFRTPYQAMTGDTYAMLAGCDKTLDTCRDRFDNILNFGGEPHIGGFDKMIQVGRKS